ncbi:Gibberellin 20 oxidase 1 [Nymphaea thermarum]|nr:Gibberellin 20 oxidase 1 [Nymphaea thermarum]
MENHDVIIEEHELPLIDLHKLKAGRQEREKCVRNMAKASSEWGFFQVVNHGISTDLLKRMSSEQAKVFRQPFEKKAKEKLLDFSLETYRWGAPSATNLQQLSWSEAFHIPLPKSSDSSYSDNTLRGEVDAVPAVLGGWQRQAGQCQLFWVAGGASPPPRRGADPPPHAISFERTLAPVWPAFVAKHPSDLTSTPMDMIQTFYEHSWVNSSIHRRLLLTLCFFCPFLFFFAMVLTFLHGWLLIIFRRTINEYAAAVSDLAQQLVQLLTESLGFRTSYFAQNCGPSSCYLRLNRYPPCPVSSEVCGLISHTDSDFLTILHQDQVGGLQLKKDGKWITVKPNQKALIVNIGDLFQAWSNDAYKSVEHRVMTNRKVERFSVAFFLCPSYDTIIETCRRPAIYRKFTFGEFRQQVQEDVRSMGHKIGLPRFLV